MKPFRKGLSQSRVSPPSHNNLAHVQFVKRYTWSVHSKLKAIPYSLIVVVLLPPEELPPILKNSSSNISSFCVPRPCRVPCWRSSCRGAWRTPPPRLRSRTSSGRCAGAGKRAARSRPSTGSKGTGKSEKIIDSYKSVGSKYRFGNPDTLSLIFYFKKSLLKVNKKVDKEQCCVGIRSLNRSIWQGKK